MYTFAHVHSLEDIDTVNYILVKLKDFLEVEPVYWPAKTTTA